MRNGVDWHSDLAYDPDLLSSYLSTVSDDMDWMYRTEPGVETASNADFCFSSVWSRFETWLSSTSLATATEIVDSNDGESHTFSYLMPGFAPAAFAEDPCCGPCSLFVNSAQVMYFPPATGTTPAITSFVSDGYTFVSPSVYVSYIGMGTMHMPCFSGVTSYNTIVGYPLEALSTIMTKVQPFTVMPRVFTTLPYDIANIHTQIGASCLETPQTVVIKETGRTTILDGITFTGPTCTPKLAFPSSYHSELKDCHISIMVFDPPKYLNPTTSLDPPSPSAEPGLVPDPPAPISTKEVALQTTDPLVNPAQDPQLPKATPVTTPANGNKPGSPAANDAQITSAPIAGPSGQQGGSAGLPPAFPLVVVGTVAMPPAIVIDQKSFAAIGPSALAVRNQYGKPAIITAGGAGTVIDGELVYLRPDNTLVVGSRVYAPPSRAVSGDSGGSNDAGASSGSGEAHGEGVGESSSGVSSPDHPKGIPAGAASDIGNTNSASSNGWCRDELCAQNGGVDWFMSYAGAGALETGVINTGNGTNGITLATKSDSGGTRRLVRPWRLW